MTSKFSRFLHLERSRGERPTLQEPSPLQSGNRFEALAERGAAPQATAVPETHLERFRGEAPLAFEEAPSEAQRFPRCGSCESENGRFAQECGVCGADLNTPQQRAYNEELWKTRQAQEQALQQTAAAERQEDEARYARLMEQLIAQEKGGRWHAAFQHRSPGLGLLGLIPHPLVRWGVVAVLIALPLLISSVGTRMARKTGMGLGLFLLLMFLPRVFKPWRRF